MHGHKRSEYKAYQRDPNVAAKLGAKAEQWRTLDAQLIHIRSFRPAAAAAPAAPEAPPDTITAVTVTTAAATSAATAATSATISDDAKALALTAKLLTVNPDPLTLWNHRRELLVDKHRDGNGDGDGDDGIAAAPSTTTTMTMMSAFTLTLELDLTQTALQNNPKAYGAWFHRKWCLQQWLLTTTTATTTTTTTAADPAAATAVLLAQELELTVQFLQRDERNFHCWNYRRFIVSCLLQQQQQQQQQQQLLLLQQHQHQHQQHQQSAIGETTAAAPAPTAAAAFDGSWAFDSAARSALMMGAQVAAKATKLTLRENTYTHTHTPEVVVPAAVDVDVDEPQVAESDTATDTASDTDTDTATAAILQNEWDFCGRKIGDNFSNFSAFHYRSKLLPWMLQLQQQKQQQKQQQQQQQTQTQAENKMKEDLVVAVWTTEFQLVENAIFTEPDDQTAWWYHRFLLDSAGQAVVDANVTASSSTDNNSTSTSISTSNINSAWYAALLQQQQSQLQELVSEVADSKWAWLGYLLVLERLHDHRVSDTVREQAAILQQLVTLDPDRQARYRHLLKKATSTSTSTQTQTTLP
jgi:hypothetical protein